MPAARCAGETGPEKFSDLGGGFTIVGCGRSSTLLGKVFGSLPLGFTLPKSTLPTAFAPSLPAYQASRIAAGASTQGMVTGLPVSSTTIVFGFAAATAATTASWLSVSERLGRSMPSHSQ